MAVALYRALHADYRGYSIDELVKGQAYPEVEAVPPQPKETDYVPEATDRD